MSDNFKDIVSNNAKLQAAFHSFTDKIIAEAKAEWGVDLNKAGLADLNAVKVVTLSGGNEELGDTWRQELEKTNADVKRAIQIRELATAFSDKDHDQHDAVQEEWAALSIHQRMAQARKMDAAKKKPEPKATLTDAERKAAVNSLTHMRGGARIAEARRRGVA